mmetsp:Transcript_22363/g.48498  ORF Transcript_22363/g.48498 Transcript_22363/m.48498 type:complete len:783 (-) Transcript_22363:88-2436(-)
MASPHFVTSGVQKGGAAASNKPFWEFNTHGIGTWIRQLTPGVPNSGGMLFPKRPNNATTASADNAAAQEEFRSKLFVGNTLLQNLIRALSSASSHDGGGGEPNPAKRPKIETSNGITINGKVGDVYQILDPSFAKSSGAASSELSTGAILSRMTLGGLVNALAAVEGGVVDTLTCIPLSDLSNGNGGVDEARIKEERKKQMDVVIATAGNLPLKELIKLARGLHRSISARTEMDILSTTPRRIADLLCPEISDYELKSIRRRVHDTVVLGLGTNSSAQAAALEDESKEIPVAARTAKHELEQWKRCDTCGNNEQSNFILDRKNGDLICTNCGTVVSESIMHEGSQFRKFEGEEDRNHHGDAPNPLFSNSHNMGTTLGGMSFQTGAGMGGYGSGGRGGIENVLRNAHAYTEMNISQFGKEEKKTRIGYKDRQKKDAFYQMAHAGDALGLHEAVVQRAKELFAAFRDDRELVQQFKGVIAACLSESFDQLSRDGRQLLKKKAGESTDGSTSDNEDEGQKVTHSRASRRNDLHSASLAGKGGLLLDATVVSHGGVGGGSRKESITGQPFETKTVATWDLDDCKSYMIEATKSIARSWVESQQSSGSTVTAESKNGAINPAMAMPKGTTDELEGRLVEHTLKICEYLESQLKQKSNGKSKLAVGARRVNTPRVADMGVLGIKWQHSYERGSGGKGGVGNSGRTIVGTKPGERSSRTAGQILLLLTSKKFGNIIGDQVAGAAFHKELKAVIGQEDAQKRMERRDEATTARLKQMNRKPWLTKRVQQL